MREELYDLSPHVETSHEIVNSDSDEDNISDGHIDGTNIDTEKNIEQPAKDMEFESTEDIFLYYKEYGKQTGFEVKRHSGAKSDGILKYVTLACQRVGKVAKSKNLLKPRQTTKTGCNARICAMLCDDNKWRLSMMELNHSHVCSPKKSRRFRCCRFIQPHVQRRIDMNDDIGVLIHKNIDSIVEEARGYEEMACSTKDMRNRITERRRLKLDGGDAFSLQQYFRKVQKIDKEFFFSIDLDEDCRIKNLFWADGRSIAAYDEFNDVITFDTTYLTYKYDMPFAPFVGVNHHGQSTLFGYGLISNEDIDTFEWLFDTWLTCMSGKPPNAIIADQCRAMKNAIEKVFPGTRHSWFLWHIMKKIPEKLSGYDKYQSLISTLKCVVYDTLSINEFENYWNVMIIDYGLNNNTLLQGLYEERFRWVPCFVKTHFWAGMSTTQRSESMNAFFDGYVNAKTSLKQFVEKYDRALLDKVEKERAADFNSFYSQIPTISDFPMEKQLQSLYTTSKFKEFKSS